MKTIIILSIICACSAVQNYTIRKFDRRYDISDGFGWLSGLLGGNDYHENRFAHQHGEKQLPVENRVPYAVEQEVPVDEEDPEYQGYIVEKQVPYPVKEYIKVPYVVQNPYEVIKKVPHKVRRPHNVRIPRPYIVGKRKPAPVRVLVRQPYTVEKKIPYQVRVKVPVQKPFVVEKKVPVKRPTIVQLVRPYPAEKHIPVQKPVLLEIPVHKPYPSEDAKLYHNEVSINTEVSIKDDPTFESLHTQTNTENIHAISPVISEPTSTKFNENTFVAEHNNGVKLSQSIDDWKPIGAQHPSSSQPEVIYKPELVKPTQQTSHYTSQSPYKPENYNNNQYDEVYFQNDENKYSEDYGKYHEDYDKHVINQGYKQSQYEAQSGYSTNGDYHKGVVESIPQQQFVQSSYSVGADDSIGTQKHSWQNHFQEPTLNKQPKYSQEIKEYVIRDDRALENYPSEYVVKASEQDSLYNNAHISTPSDFQPESLYNNAHVPTPSDSHVFNEQHEFATEGVYKGFGEFKSSPQITQNTDQWVGVQDESNYAQPNIETAADYNYNQNIQTNSQSEHIIPIHSIQDNPQFEALVHPKKPDSNRQAKGYSVSEVNFENYQHSSKDATQYGYEPPRNPTKTAVEQSNNNQFQPITKAPNRYLPEAAKQMYAFQQVAQADAKTNQYGYSQQVRHEYKAPQNSHQQPAQVINKPNYSEVSSTQSSVWKQTSDDDWKPIDTNKNL